MTIDYDRKCAEEFAAIQFRVDRYFIELTTGCPYGLPHMAYFYQAMFAPLSQRAMELFLAAGYRRNGNCLYAMHCRECSACVPIRLQPARFRPNRNQRRIMRKNSDLDIRLVRLQANDESLELCDRFLRNRYPQEQNSAEGYYSGFFCNTIVESGQIEFRLDGRLVGTSIIDLGDNWMNAVYFFFDPDEHKRSLGTYNILSLVQMCRDLGIDYLYLGYTIEGVSAMHYKENFRPHQLYRNNAWEPDK